MSGQVRLCKKLKIRIKKPLDSQAVLLFCFFIDYFLNNDAKSPFFLYGLTSTSDTT